MDTSLFSHIKDRIKNQNKGPKIEFEFQELCLEMEKIYGKLVWTLPYKRGFTEKRIRKAHEICKNKGKEGFPYLMGVLNKLKPYEY